MILAYNGAEIAHQDRPQGDHRANVVVEMAARETKRQCRTLRISAEHQTGVRIAGDSPLLSWLPRSAARINSNMRIGRD